MADDATPPGGLPWRDIIETAVDGISLLEPVVADDGRIVDFRCVYLNPAGAAVIERSVDDAVGRLATELSPGAAENGRIALYASAYLGQPFWGELRHRSELVDRTVGVRASRHGDHLVIRFRDVTETAELRVAEKQARRRLETLVDAVRDPIFAFDQDWRFTFVNEGACQMSGLTTDELIGAPARAVFPELVGTELERRLLAVQESRTSANFETEYPATAPAQSIWLEVRAYPEPVEGGVVVVLHDQGPRRAMQERIEQLRRLESITTLAGGVAHDFNNLLTVIGGHVSLLRTEPGLRPSALEDLAAVSEAVRRATRLTGQLLTFSRRQMVRPEVVDLGAHVRMLQPVVERQVSRRHDVEVMFPDEPAQVLVDPSELDHALLSLVDNAVDAMPDGGRLRLRVGVVEVGQMTEATGGDDSHRTSAHDGDAARRAGLEPGTYAFVEIADDGVGMTSEVIERAREPFFTTKPAGVGTGLGMSAVHGMVEQAGGVMAIDSEPGAGTVVTLYLPHFVGPGGEPGGPGNARAGRGGSVPAVGEGVSSGETPDRGADPREARGRRTVLVVDDNIGVRELAARALEAAGYHVACAVDGPHALAMLAAHDGVVDLLVTDVVMPGMSGTGLADEARARGLVTTVLLMSGYTDEESARQAVSGHDVEFLAKPFGPADLVEAVQRALE